MSAYRNGSVQLFSIIGDISDDDDDDDDVKSDDNTTQYDRTTDDDGRERERFSFGLFSMIFVIYFGESC